VRRAGVVVAAAVAYFAVAAVVWWHLFPLGLAHGISATEFGDPEQDVWFLAWVPHALGSGLNPFVSHAMFAPKGINLVINTSILLPSLVMSPITELFGPVVSFNVAVLLAPVLSSLVAFVVFRRWAPFTPGRWLAGLFYGFSPFVLNDLVWGHLHLTIIVFPPIALVLLDDLLVRPRGNPAVKGALIGVVFAAQFLTGQEVFAMMIMLTLPGVAILAIRHHGQVRERLRRAAVGATSAAVVGGVLLAFPFYELLAGPRRFPGTVFPVPYGFVIWLKAWLWPIGLWPERVWPAYVGIPLLLVIAVSCRVIRSGVLRFATAMAGMSLIYALGGAIHWTPVESTHIPLPDAIFSHWPLLKNLLPIRFALMVDLFMALGLAVVLDRVHGSLLARWSPAVPSGEEQPATDLPHGGGVGRAGAAHRRRSPRPRAALPATLGAVGLGVIALISPALGSRIPFATRTITVPAVFRSAALTHLPAGTILLGFPILNGFKSDPLVWQAVEHMPYDLVAGYGFIPGPGDKAIGSLSPSPVLNVYGDAQVGLLPPTPVPSEIAGVRSNLESWHVSVIVEYKGYTQLEQPAQLAAVIDAATGVKPEMIDGAYVWRLPH
jgi:hypothetical protein